MGSPRRPPGGRSTGTIAGHTALWTQTSAAGAGTESSDGHDATRGDGAEPDARFTLANERTFLAWSRTALALVVAGLGIVQLLPPFPGVPWGRHAVGVPLIALGAAVSVIAYWEWRRTQAALRHGGPLPRSMLPGVLAGTVAGIAVLSAVVLLISAVR
jgi:putative membrane protein